MTPLSTASTCRLLGLYCYIHMRQLGRPRSPASYQKEFLLWSEAYRNEPLLVALQQHFKSLNIMHRHPLWLSEALVNDVRSLDQLSQDQFFQLLDGGHLLNPPSSTHRSSLAIVRPRHHPLFQTCQLARLLPHEQYAIAHLAQLHLLLGDCTFSTVSGWPRSLSNVIRLIVRETTDAQVAWDWVSVPAMPRLMHLSLSPSVESLQGMPPFGRTLTALDLSRCNRLRTLRGPTWECPSLTYLSLPASLENLDGMWSSLPLLATLDASRCQSVVSLKGLPSTLPRLEQLFLPCGLENIVGLPICLDRLRKLDLTASVRLMNLAGLAASLPRLETLALSPSVETLLGMPVSLESLQALDLTACRLLTTLMGLPAGLPKLERLALPASLESLEGLPLSMDSLRRMDLSRCDSIRRLTGLPTHLPVLGYLLLPKSLESLDGMNMQGMPRLKHLRLSSKLRSTAAVQEQLTILSHHASACAVVLYTSQ
ncbi:uncharacterized protein BJ171DRAFT_181245 [Polychytrium aggregatum]|uniref:uncharacterized protein n=1 Tax=Polychytrium aggregatum TaxID=110093 RepID=UPI0022FE3B7F|nr:uncharacterized protein BJ171DRAFT_181245 [Polychytrium aggregatum]KAI9202493.1 hypothetical protein BJ171DRAFT_181245 [Polychytrium aggregatum]